MANLDQRGEKNHTWKGGMTEFICEKCGEHFSRYDNRDANKFCSLECYYNTKRYWKKNSCGYISQMVNGKEVMQHRFIVESVLGRPLKREEVVHHINGDKTDNRNENLLVCENGFHFWLHWQMSQKYMDEHFCKDTFRRFEGEPSSNNALNSGKPKLNEHGNPEPSPNGEGAETIIGASFKDEGIVQTTNDDATLAVKTVDGTDPRLYFCGNT